MRSQLWLLLLHDARRARAALAHPRPAAWLGGVLPAALLVGTFVVAGSRSHPDPSGAAGAAGLGVMAGAVPAFFAYGTLFRAPDDGFLRRLGLAPGALSAERALRLLGLGAGGALLVLLSFHPTPHLAPRAAAVLTGALLAAWALALLGFGAAARAMARHPVRTSWGVLSLGMGFDRELSAAAPLVQAPFLPLLGSVAAGAWLGAAPGAAWGRVALLAAGAAACCALALPWLAEALPRMAPRALEMAFAPPPATHAGALVARGGLNRLLPHGAAAVRARDAAVGARRFPWGARIVWPVAVVGVFALARWGDEPRVRGAVAAEGALALVLQSAAVVGLGQLERRGPRWVDRALGLGGGARLLGRWAWGVGMALWLVLPLALTWALRVGGAGGWVWIAAALAAPALAAAASLLAAGR